jgi:hypothetical protein
MFRAKAEFFFRALVANPVARAFALSVLAHILLISGVEVGRQAGWWKHSLLPQSDKSRLQQEVEKAERQMQEQIQRMLQNQVPEAQLVFVEVDPAVAVKEPPKETKYYSSQSSVAANPIVADKNTPKVDGKQDKIPKTFDTLRPDPRTLQPAPQEPKPPQKQQQKIESKTPEPKVIEQDVRPARDEKPGETLVARAAPRPQPAQEEQKPEPRRPRTLVEAKAQKGIIEGQKMRNDGGARRARLDAAFDVRATPFGAYDTAFIQAVQTCWFRLLDERPTLPNDTGKVVLEFRLNYDGRITAMRVVESDVSEHLAWTCQRAVLDPAPYAKFPSDMRRLVNNDFREIRFTFYYNQ